MIILGIITGFSIAVVIVSFWAMKSNSIGEKIERSKADPKDINIYAEKKFHNANVDYKFLKKHTADKDVNSQIYY